MALWVRSQGGVDGMGWNMRYHSWSQKHASPIASIHVGIMIDNKRNSSYGKDTDAVEQNQAQTQIQTTNYKHNHRHTSRSIDLPMIYSETTHNKIPLYTNKPTAGHSIQSPNISPQCSL